MLGEGIGKWDCMQKTEEIHDIPLMHCIASLILVQINMFNDVVPMAWGRICFRLVGEGASGVHGNCDLRARRDRTSKLREKMEEAKKKNKML